MEDTGDDLTAVPDPANMTDYDYDDMVAAIREREEHKKTNLFLETENNRRKTQISHLAGEMEGVEIALTSAQAYIASYEGRKNACIDAIEKLGDKKEALIDDINALHAKITAAREDRESTARLNETMTSEFNEIVDEKKLVVKRLSAISKGLKDISATKDQRLPSLKWYDAILKKIYVEFLDAQNRMEVSMMLKKK